MVATQSQGFNAIGESLVHIAQVRDLKHVLLSLILHLEIALSDHAVQLRNGLSDQIQRVVE